MIATRRKAAFVAAAGIVGSIALGVPLSQPAAAAGATVGIGSADVVESAGTKVPAGLVVTLDAPLTTDECIWFHTVDGTATGAAKLTANDGTQDYQSKTGAITIRAGKTTGKIAITVNADTVAEPREDLTVVLERATVRGTKCLSTDATDATVTLNSHHPVGTLGIVDNTAVSPTVTVAPVSVVEGGGVAFAVKNSVGISAPQATDECVFYVTDDGTATGAFKPTLTDGTQDYKATFGSFVKIRAGKTNATITTKVIPDAVGEPNETFLLEIAKIAKPSAGKCDSNAPQDPAITIATPLVTNTIFDDDAPVPASLQMRSTQPELAYPIPSQWFASTTSEYTYGQHPLNVFYVADAYDQYGNYMLTVDTLPETVWTAPSGCFLDFAEFHCPLGIAPGSYTVSAEYHGLVAEAPLTVVDVDTVTMTCRLDNYDVDNDLPNGCEIPIPGPVGHTQGTAVSLGNVPCFDSPGLSYSTGKLASDQRVHVNPAVQGFNSVTGAAPQWFSMQATGGTCFNDVLLTLQVHDSAAATCYKLTVQTDHGTFTAQTDNSGAVTISRGSGSYSDGSTVYVVVEKTCGSTTRENVTYSFSGHL